MGKMYKKFPVGDKCEYKFVAWRNDIDPFSFKLSQICYKRNKFCTSIGAGIATIPY